MKVIFFIVFTIFLIFALLGWAGISQVAKSNGWQITNIYGLGISAPIQYSTFPLLIFVVLSGIDAYIYNRNLIEAASATKIREEINKIMETFAKEQALPFIVNRKKKYEELLKAIEQGDGV